MRRRPALLWACLVGGAVFGAAAARADQDAWAAAREALTTFDWHGAVSQYEALRQANAQGSAKWVEATFCEAVAQQHEQPASAETIGHARQLFQDVIDHGKDARYVARSLMNLGRIAELPDYPQDTIDLVGARGYYEQVMRRWPDEAIGSEAALRAGASMVMAYDAPDFKQVKAGIALLEKWLADHPKNPYANVMWQYAGDSYFQPLRDYADALRCYDEVEKLGWADAGNQGAWYWRCAQIAERYVHDRNRAVYYYTALIEKTPANGQAYAAWEALKRLHAPLPNAPYLEPNEKRKTP